MKTSRVPPVLAALFMVAALIPSRTIASPPNPPSNIVASGALVTSGGTYLNLAWDDNSKDDAGFIIQASTDNGATWAPIAYTPNDYITLHSEGSAVPALGSYSIGPNMTRGFRVAATHPTLGTSAYSSSTSVTFLSAPICSNHPTIALTEVPTLTAHVGFPIDLKIRSNCFVSGDHYCPITVPSGMTIDFSGGLVSWTPTASGTYLVSLGYGTGPNNTCSTKTDAKTEFTINVDDFSMLQPLFRDYRSEATQVQIVGGFPSDFSFYAFYSLDLAASYDGAGLVAVSTPSSGPIFSPGLLANWDITPHSNAARRLLVMITQSPTGANSALYDPVIIDRSAFNNWPKRLPNANPRGAVAVDVDGDGSNAEIVANTRDGADGGPYCWNLDGSLRWKAPSTSGLTTSEVAVGDVNNNGTNEVVTVSAKTVRVFNGLTGALVAQASLVGTTKSFLSGASLADLNSDGKLEILVNVLDAAHAWTYAYTYNGTTTLASYTGWPQDGTAHGMDSPNATAPPATADLNHDGVLEVIVDNQTSIYAWSATGAVYFHTAAIQPSSLYPDTTDVNGGAASAAFAQPSIGDLDQPPDGNLEIVVGRNVFNSTGSSIGTITASGPATGMSAAIGEFDPASAGPEIILGADVSSGPTRGWLRKLGGDIVRGPATIVDGGLDDQSHPQTYALMGTMGYLSTQFTANISAFHSNGDVDEDYPKALYGTTGPGSAAQAGDFDNDGNEDVLVAVTDSSYGTVVALYENPGSHPFDPNNNPWPMAGHDPQRTGRNTCKQQRASCTSSPQCCSAKCAASTCR